MHTTSLEEYHKQLKVFASETEGWPEKLVNYYNTHIDSDFQTSARWKLESFKMYNKNSGITNNPSESSNNSLKSALNFKKCALPKFAYAFYFISVRSLCEIHAGFELTGEFQLTHLSLPNKTKLQITKEDEMYMADVINDHEMEEILLKGKYPSAFTKKEKLVQPLKKSQFVRGIAELLIEKERIHFVPRQKVFLVAGLSGCSYVVSIGKKSRCSCARRSKCTSYFIGATLLL
jgi:hypothetical protein